MNKTTLRVVFATNPPDIYNDCLKFPTIVPSFKCPYPGWTAEVLGMVAEYLKWEIQPIIVRSKPGELDTGAFDNATGEWSGLLGYLDKNEADTICLSYEYLKSRDIYFDYSFPLYNMQVVYVSKHTTSSILTALWNSFTPFPYPVWLIIIASLIIQATYATFVRYLEWKMGHERFFYPLEKYGQYLKFFLLQPEETKAFKSAA
uniref:Uncharacterized protein n=1 Tax=Acrobeloides nanus TaxID=290746 RepID=A0A914C7U3_9BILA